MSGTLSGGGRIKGTLLPLARATAPLGPNLLLLRSISSRDELDASDSPIVSVPSKKTEMKMLSHFKT